MEFVVYANPEDRAAFGRWEKSLRSHDVELGAMGAAEVSERVAHVLLRLSPEKWMMRAFEAGISADAMWAIVQDCAKLCVAKLAFDGADTAAQKRARQFDALCAADAERYRRISEAEKAKAA